jgi:predicted metal-dependent peptidase
MANKSNTTTKAGSNKPKGAREKVKALVDEMLKLQERLPEIEAEAEDKISRAKARLMQIEPFFAMLLFKMPTMPCYQIPTMGTDGTMLLYNPTFVAEKLLRKDVLFVLLHEICHVFFKHHIRGPVNSHEAQKLFDNLAKSKNKKKDVFVEATLDKVKHKLKEWNYATDYTINGHIKQNCKIPHSKALDPDGEIGMKYDKDLSDSTSEKVYDKIKTPYKPDKCGQCGADTPGGVDCPNGCKDDMGMGIGGIFPVGLGELTEAEAAGLEKELESDVHAAAMSAKKAGKLPAGVQQTIKDLYTTSTPWQDILRTVMTSMAKQDYTFQYPNKRYTTHMMDYGVIMPSLWGEEYTNVGFIMDTSGSVGQREKEILASELRNILEDYNIKLHVLYCDTKAYVKDIQVLTKEDIKNGHLQLNVKGGGGTSMRPAFDYYRDNMDEHSFEVVICMTDMWLSDWGRLGKEPAFSTYWLRLPNSDKKVKPDFGVIVDVVLDE